MFHHVFLEILPSHVSLKINAFSEIASLNDYNLFIEQKFTPGFLFLFLFSFINYKIQKEKHEFIQTKKIFILDTDIQH